MGAIDDHLEWCRIRNLRPATIQQRGYALARLERAVGRPVIAATADELGHWFNELGISPESRATELSHARGFYRWAVLHEYRHDDPTARLARPRITRRLPRPLDRADVDHALDAAGDQTAAMLALMAFAGLRACEVAALRREDVLDHRAPPVLIVHDGKGGRQRIVPLHPIVVRAIDRLHVARGPLFRGTRGAQLQAHRVSQIMGAHFRACGIDATGHQARHHFGTAVYAATLDLRTTQELLGHASPVTTAGYSAWSPSSGADAVLAL